MIFKTFSLGDGRISFEDFSFGFRDFLTPGSRRGSAQLGLTPNRQSSFRLNQLNSIEEVEAKQHEMEVKHQKAQQAWRHLAEHLSRDDIRNCLSIRYVNM